MTLIKKIAFCLLLITSIFASDEPCCFARWAQKEDASFKYENITKRIYIKKNGNSTIELEQKIKILKENAKKSFAHHTTQYNARLQKIHILEASTYSNGKKYLVKNDKIRDYPLASANKHLSEDREINISFPKVEVNSTISLKEICVLHYILPNFFSTKFSFGQSYTETADIYITSELPLHIKIQDPEKLLHVTKKTIQNKQKKLHYLEIHLKKPIYKAIIDETSDHLNPKFIPIVFLTATEKLPHFEKVFSSGYAQIQKEPLPREYEEIASIANTKNTPIEKINTVTSLLSEKITYLADSRTMSNGYFPQSLQTVVDQRLGDCKDFATGTCAILQAIGIQAKVVGVYSTEPYLPFSCDLPGHHASNHAIVKVELPDGPLWIDPTASISMSNHIWPYMSHKKVMVLGENTSTYETIPNMDPAHYHVLKHETWNMHNSGISKVKGNLKLKGVAASFLTGAGNYLSQESIKDIFISIIDKKQGQILKSNVTLPDLHSRIVKDLSFDYNLQIKNPILKTSAGLAIPISFKAIELFSIKPNTVSDLYLESPKIIESSIAIENIKPIGNQALNCDIQSPWVNISRTVEYGKNKVLVHQKMEIKTKWIEGTELESAEFKKLQLAIEQHFNKGVAIVFEKA